MGGCEPATPRLQMKVEPCTGHLLVPPGLGGHHTLSYNNSHDVCGTKAGRALTQHSPAHTLATRHWCLLIEGSHVCGITQPCFQKGAAPLLDKDSG